MKHALIGAVVLTFCALLLGSVTVWGASVNMRAVTSDFALRRKQGLPPAPLWYESLWRRSPSLVLSAAYFFVSLVFALNVLKECAFFLLKPQSGFESPYELYEQCTPTEFWIGCGIWLMPLLVAVFIFVRSAISVRRRRENAPQEHSQSH